MNKRLIIFLVVIVILTALGYVIYTQFEIYPEKKPTAPLREVRANNFAALERWLVSTGHDFRIEKRSNAGQIAQAQENTVVAFAAFCNWNNASGILLPWIERGGNLLICVDDWFDEGTELAQFLCETGITIADPYSIEKPELPENLKAWNESPVPNLDRDICFLIADNAADGKISIIRDNNGYIRLAQLTLGTGSLSVTGKPYFMYNTWLNTERNAVLAWQLTGAQMEENPGLLFIRDRHIARGLFGKIAERGNFPPLLVSVLLLVICGFWMVIPQYGAVYSEKKTTARPLRQRFLAEIRFLKKYDALESYLHTYLSWLKPRLSRVNPDEEEIRLIEQALQNPGQKPLKYRDLIKALRKLQTFTERL